MSINDLRIKALLSAQRALIGEVTTNMRAAALKVEDSSIELRIFFDSEISEEDEENVRVIETEIMADFPDNEVSASAIFVPMGRKIDYWDEWIFKRKERYSE